jgi:chaperone BCS1
MLNLIDILYNNYHNATKMTIFNYFKTGNVIFDAILSTIGMSIFSILINYIYNNNNNLSYLFNIHCVYDLFYKKNCMILEGKRSSTTCGYTSMYHVSAIYSNRFKAIWNYIIENIHNNNSIYQIKESYSSFRTEIDEKRRDEAIFMVFQNKNFTITKDIFVRSNVTEENIQGEKDISKTKTDKITIYIYSYVYSLDHLIKFVNNITEHYLNTVKNSRNNKKFIYQLNKIKYDDKESKLNCWNEYNFESSRTFDNLFFEGKKELIEKVDFFINNRKWYDEKGITHTLGIGLHGPPGTGKTSFAKALANYLKRHLIIISLKLIKTKQQLDDFYFEHTYNEKNEYNSIDFQNKIILFEDIDCIGEIVLDRKFKKKTNNIKKCNNRMNNISQVVQNICELNRNEYGAKNIVMNQEDIPITLDDILNLWDGIRETPGRILLISSNHYDKLDPALIRPGRIDITHKLNNANYNTISEIYLHLFGNKIDKQKLKKVKEYFYSPAELINIYISHKEENTFMNRLLLNKRV